jgi:hypothetical protein
VFWKIVLNVVRFGFGTSFAKPTQATFRPLEKSQTATDFEEEEDVEAEDVELPDPDTVDVEVADVDPPEVEPACVDDPVAPLVLAPLVPEPLVPAPLDVDREPDDDDVEVCVPEAAPPEPELVSVEEVSTAPVDPPHDATAQARGASGASERSVAAKTRRSAVAWAMRALIGAREQKHREAEWLT